MSTAIPDLRAVIVDAITNTPRSLQTALGPSEIGCGCSRCLALMLAGHKTAEATIPWLPTVGTAVHEWLETATLAWLAKTGSDRYLPEVRCEVGHLRGEPVTGHADVYDTHTGTVVDFKVVGATTLKKVKASGPGTTYRNQIHCYGRGLTSAGHDVRHVAIWFLPRNAISMDAGHIHTEPYDEAIATAALDRANAIAGGVDALGIDTVLTQIGAHTGSEFACSKWAQDSSAAPAVEVTADAFLRV